MMADLRRLVAVGLMIAITIMCAALLFYFLSLPPHRTADQMFGCTYAQTDAATGECE